MPAPFWFRPLHFICCKDGWIWGSLEPMKHLENVDKYYGKGIQLKAVHSYSNTWRIHLKITDNRHTSHLVAWALACMMLRKGFISVRLLRAGMTEATFCRYGQYLHATSIAKNCALLGRSSLWRYIGYANISPRYMLRAFKRKPCRHTATSTPSSSSLEARLEVSLAAAHWESPHVPLPFICEYSAYTYC